MFTGKPKSSLLLVEDSEDDAFFFRYALEKSGLDCPLQHLTNGAEAVDFLRSLSLSDPHAIPPVMFLDLKMPVLNGFEVLAWLQTQPFVNRIRVIVLTGSDVQSDKVHAFQLGALAYLVKPISVPDLKRFLHDVCPSKQPA